MTAVLVALFCLAIGVCIGMLIGDHLAHERARRRCELVRGHVPPKPLPPRMKDKSP